MIPILDTIWTRRKKIADERMTICKTCEHLENLRRCNKCGCFMDAKTMFMDSECPLDKWHPVKEDTTVS